MKQNARKMLGDILVDRGVISAQQLEEALTNQKASRDKLGRILLDRRIIEKNDLYAALSEHHGLEYIPHLEFHDPDGLFRTIPVEFLIKNKLVPYRVDKKTIFVGIADPLNLHPFDDLKMLFPEYRFETVLADEDEIGKLIHAHFSHDTSAGVIGELDESSLEGLEEGISETEDILDSANAAPLIRFVNNMISQAIREHASDIHVEPYELDLVVRYRIDGILYRKDNPPKKLQNAIISRIKIMSNLNIAENRLPQDGRIQLKIGGKDIDIRVSIFPTHYGERVVLRLLNKTDMKFELEAIGFSPKQYEDFSKLIEKPHGIIIVTGPTGSGKTTTLYCALMKLNTDDVNILTVEDPIEYQLTGVGQMQVKPKIDLTFASGLRSILRQDPDIIMVGEVRDLETAEIAVQSALTGHRVFTTMHTNDASSAVTRLLDMGIEPFLIASSVNAFIAQRLVRTLCPSCKVRYNPTPLELKEIGITKTMLKTKKVYKAKGCDKCLNTGYSGRTGIYELLPVTNPIRKLIVDKADASAIKTAAVQHGMRTLLEDGAIKVLAGATSIDEVMRVSGSLN